MGVGEACVSRFHMSIATYFPPTPPSTTVTCEVYVVNVLRVFGQDCLVPGMGAKEIMGVWCSTNSLCSWQHCFRVCCSFSFAACLLGVDAFLAAAVVATAVQKDQLWMSNLLHPQSLLFYHDQVRIPGATAKEIPLVVAPIVRHAATTFQDQNFVAGLEEFVICFFRARGKSRWHHTESVAFHFPNVVRECRLSPESGIEIAGK